MKLIRSAVSVGLFTILSRILGCVREILQAHFIGPGMVNDAVVIALKMPSLFRRMFAEGAFNVSFVPMFSRILVADGKKSAFDFAQQILVLLSLSLLVLTVLVEFLIPFALPCLLSGFEATPRRLVLVVQFTQITFPFIFFISLTAFYNGILNSFDRFALAASSPAIGNLVIILAMVFLIPYVETPGHALAWGGLACGVIQLLWVMIPCHKEYFKPIWKWPVMSPRVKEFWKILLPAALGSGVVQINVFIDMLIASHLPVGEISYISWADRLSQLPLSVIGVAVSTALLPILSKQIRNKHFEDATHSQNIAIQFSFFLALPAMIGLIMMAPSLVQQIYCHGKTTEAAVLPTAYTLIALVSGLPAYILNKVFATTFFSNGDTKTPIVVGVGSMILNIVICILLLKSHGCVGIGIATSVAGWIGSIVLGILLYKRNLFRFTKELTYSLLRIVAAAFILALYLEGYQPIWEGLVLQYVQGTPFLMSHDILTRTLIVCAFLLPSLLIFVASGYVFKIYTWEDIRTHLRFNKKTNKMDVPPTE